MASLRGVQEWIGRTDRVIAQLFGRDAVGTAGFVEKCGQGWPLVDLRGHGRPHTKLRTWMSAFWSTRSWMIAKF